MQNGHLYVTNNGAIADPNETNVTSQKGYIAAYSTPLGAKVWTKNQQTTMKIKVPEAEILRTPIKIEKLSLWNWTLSGFLMNSEFHGFQMKKYFPKKNMFFF